jgi:hypothetical protein
MALLTTMLPRWARHVGRALLALVALAPASAGAAVPAQDVQAVFLLNLTRFVRWPDAVFATDDAPLVIACLQDDRLWPVLVEAVKDEKTGRHPIEVRRVRSAAELDGSHLLYLSSATLDGAVQMLGPLRNKPILIVSDADGILRLGGHVQLFTRGGQLRLRLDVRNLKRADLTASAQLLRVAEVVGNF